jgi:hypothetical protein
MLTITAVQAAKAHDKAYKLSDGNGLYLLIETNGSKLWRLRYFFDNKEKMLSLGAFPDVTIAQARTKRDDAPRLRQERTRRASANRTSSRPRSPRPTRSA